MCEWSGVAMVGKVCEWSEVARSERWECEEGGASIRGGRLLKNPLKKGGVYSRGAFNRSITVDYLPWLPLHPPPNWHLLVKSN